MSPGALQGLKAAAERIVLDPRYHDILTVLKSARNGAVYGAKVRFPHALVMIFLFRSGTFREKFWLVFRATRAHARNLSKFAVIYKATCLLLKRYGATPGKEGTSSDASLAPASADKGPHPSPADAPGIAGPYDTFIAGLLGGYFVFGQRSKRTGRISSVSQQIVIYIFARVALALARLAIKPGHGLPGVSSPRAEAIISQYASPVFASASWAMVMHLFRWHAAELQPSLRSSMTYIYSNADHWDSLRNFMLHNK